MKMFKDRHKRFDNNFEKSEEDVENKQPQEDIEEPISQPEPVKNEVVVKKQSETVSTNQTNNQNNNPPEVDNNYVKNQFLNLAKDGIDKSKTASEQGKELLNIASMASLFTNNEFIEEYQKQQKATIIKDLKDTGKAEAIKNAAKKQEARNLRNAALFNAFKPFFKGFMHQEDPFGLIPMGLCILIFFPVYLIITLILGTIRYTLEKINDVFTALAGFTKPAQAIGTTAVVIALCGALILGLLYALQLIFGWAIF